MVDAARKAHAHEFIKDLPQGYDTLVGERAPNQKHQSLFAQEDTDDVCPVHCAPVVLAPKALPMSCIAMGARRLVSKFRLVYKYNGTALSGEAVQLFLEDATRCGTGLLMFEAFLYESL